jgi:hypothetical protein
MQVPPRGGGHDYVLGHPSRAGTLNSARVCSCVGRCQPPRMPSPPRSTGGSQAWTTRTMSPRDAFHSSVPIRTAARGALSLDMLLVEILGRRAADEARTQALRAKPSKPPSQSPLQSSWFTRVTEDARGNL